MKKIFLIFVCAALLLSSVLMYSCNNGYRYQPEGEFYFKTSPASGDAGVTEVISLEADKATYEGEGDITVTFEVGLGRLDIGGGYGEGVENSFYVVYRIAEAPWSANTEPVWEKRIDYNESWYSDKFLSTEQEKIPTFIFPRYGEFYPIYKENVDIVFPEDVEKGYLQIWLYAIVEGWEEDHLFFSAQLYFTHEDGILNLDP